ncbi:unnamed protein product [Brassica rapa]|uniref:Uncharacterized protein n=1 Tax=Brassica campestris TaxID=3711 RepID=A0A8D9MC46_BRACM|nr:unnamed protein product [Brassica rapa]
MKNMGHIYTFYCFTLYIIYSDYSYTNCICPYAYIYIHIYSCRNFNMVRDAGLVGEGSFLRSTHRIICEI